jgi:pimeloyl-ACP methyl ester carboxylesterase
MHELAASFGVSKHLSGTLALAHEGSPQRRTAFLMFNAGVIHRIGPHRFNVKLARRLAALGWPSLRFDLAGQGDSDVAPTSQPFQRQIVADLRAALDHLQRTTGIERVVVAGICSGAHRGLAAAQEDERIVGLWMLDGFSYPTARSRRERYLRQWERDPSGMLRAWLAWPWQKLRQQFAARTAAGSADEPTEVDYGSVTPPRERFIAMLETVTRRGGHVFEMHSGSALWRYSYARQFSDSFGHLELARSVRSDFLPQIDHTLTSLDVQRRVIDAIVDWAQTTFEDQAEASKQKPA